MSTHKSSMTTGALAAKGINWMKVPDKELVTDLDDMDSVGNVKSWEKCRRLCMACDEEIQRAEKACQEVEEQEWKCQVEEVKKRQKEEEERQQKEAEAEQKWKREAEERKQATAAEARKWQQADSEAQASGSWTNVSVCIRCARLWLSCVIPAGIKKRSACGSCVKAKERCEWPEVEMTVSRAGTSPRGGEHKKWAKKVADDDDDEIVILSGQKTKQQGGGKTLKEVSNWRWGQLIQAVSTHMDVANGHLEQIASMAQSNGHKMQWHHLLMEGLVGQQQMLISRLVELSGTTGSKGAKEVAKGREEPKELQETQGEGSGGQDNKTEGALGEGLEGLPEDAPGNELGNGTGAEDGTEDAQKRDKGKGKEKAL
ncbi:hypothetical protein ID866_12107 [Astraeus odoratus]|nr:hypothetical protein ID866_12107 [Astraeus odoratus]